jgi:hypothetical protein
VPDVQFGGILFVAGNDLDVRIAVLAGKEGAFRDRAKCRGKLDMPLGCKFDGRDQKDFEIQQGLAKFSLGCVRQRFVEIEPMQFGGKPAHLRYRRKLRISMRHDWPPN